MKNEYDFGVEMVPVYTYASSPRAVGEPAYAEVIGRKAVQRTDNRAVLGIVSDKYKILPHAQVVENFREAMGAKCIEHVRVTKGGARLFLSYTFPGEKIEVAQGDFINLKLVAVNSYDGSRMLQVTFGGERLVCSNGMIGFAKLVNIEERHVGNVGIKVETLAEQIAVFKEQFQDMLPALKAMQKHHLDPVGVHDRLFDNEKVKLPTYLLDAARTEFDRAGEMTRWGAYNAMTYAITHKMRKESPEAQLRYGRVAWETAETLV